MINPIYGISPYLVHKGASLNQLPAIVNDGNTVAWYDTSDSAMMRKDGSNFVDVLYDKMIGNSTLSAEQNSGAIILWGVYKITATQANFFYTGCAVGDTFVCGTVKTCDANNKVQRVTGNHQGVVAASYKPTITVDGLVFDGTDDHLKSAIISDLAQPCTIYYVVKHLAWVATKFIFDGYGSLSGYVWTFGPGQGLQAGATTASATTYLPINQLSILKVVLNGASSSLQINELTPITFNCGAGTMGGITLASAGGISLFTNQLFKEGFFRKVADSDADKASIYKYLAVKNKFTFNTGKLVLSFDDGVIAWNTAATQLNARGVKGTFYTYTALVGLAECVTWADLNAIHSAGHDVQCHSNSHPADMTVLTQAQINAEYETVNSLFVANGLPTPTHTSYPNGSFNANVKLWTSAYRLTARETNSGNVNRFSDKYQIQSLAISNLNEAGVTGIKAKLLQAQNNKSAFVALAHGVGVANNQVSAANLDELITYAQSIGMEIVTISELYAGMNH